MYIGLYILIGTVLSAVLVLSGASEYSFPSVRRAAVWSCRASRPIRYAEIVFVRKFSRNNCATPSAVFSRGRRGWRLLELRSSLCQIWSLT